MAQKDERKYPPPPRQHPSRSPAPCHVPFSRSPPRQPAPRLPHPASPPPLPTSFSPLRARASRVSGGERGPRRGRTEHRELGGRRVDAAVFANGAKLGRLLAGRLPSWGEEGARTPFMDVTPVAPQPTADDSHPSPASKHGWPGVVRSRCRAGLTGSKQRSGMRAWRSGVILPGRKKEDGPPAFVALRSACLPVPASQPPSA